MYYYLELKFLNCLFYIVKKILDECLDYCFSVFCVFLWNKLNSNKNVNCSFNKWMFYGINLG